MIPSTIYKAVGKIGVNLTQACLIGIFVTDSESKFQLFLVAIAFLLFGLACIWIADIKENFISKKSGRKHRIKLPKNTTLTVEVEK